MNQEPNKNLYQEDEIDLFELWDILWKHRKFIALFTIGITLLAAIISFILPKTYTSKSVLVPVSNGGGAGRFSALAAMAAIYTPSKSQSDIVAVLKSLSLREAVVKDLNLVDDILKSSKKKYKYPIEVAAQKIKKDINVDLNPKENTITIKVDWKNPEMAMKINEDVIKNLRYILNHKAFTVAKMNTIFYANELHKTQKELQEAMDNLNKFQQKNDVLLPNDQLKTQLSLYSSLISQKLSLEAQIRTMSNIYTQNDPRLQQAYAKLSYINQKLKEIEGKINPNSSLSASKTLKVLPSYTTEYLKVKQLEAKYNVLSQLLAQSRLDELKNNLYVQVIDNPTYPELPSKPKKKLIVIVAFISSLFLSIFIVFIKEAIDKRKQMLADKGQNP